MSKLKIPRTARAVIEELGLVGELLTATEWRRAALLASVVRMPGSGRLPENRGTAVFETPEEFAARGVKGLRSPNTVRRYVRIWLDTVGDYPELGRTVDLPEDDWPPMRTGTDGYESSDGAQRTIDRMVEKHGVEAVASLIADNEHLTNAVNYERAGRHVPWEQRNAMARDNQGMRSRFDATVREAKASGAAHMPHDALYGLLQAEGALGVSMAKSHEFPFRSEQQQVEIESSVARCRRMLDIIERPEATWSDEDRAFLHDLGIGGPA